MTKNLDEITNFLKKLRFRKTTFGGVDEKDVWKKLDILNEKYMELYALQEERRKIIEEKYKEELVAKNKYIADLEQKVKFFISQRSGSQ